MAKQQLDQTLVRCIKTDGTSRIRHIKRYLTQDDIYMKKAGLMVAEVQAPPVKKLNKAKQKEVEDIDTRIAELEKDPEKNQSKIEDLKTLKQNIIDGR